MAIDWHHMFALGESPLGLVIRGTLVYWFLFAVFRTVLQRDVGAVGIADVLLLVIVADAAQNAMADEYRSVTDGLILISTILGWNYLFDYLAYRFPRLRRLLEPREICLIRDGKVLHRNLRREFITIEELHSKLREHGVTDIAEVKAAYMESDGGVSVITRQEKASPDNSEDASPKRPF
ncbi:MAG: hypothetical protein H6R10_1523 [Rhodocyclaceae bacterium]|nr:hypothetical protein [Rhodocyclaceae bacterium]